MDNFQFYPTGLSLAQQAWSMFKNKYPTRVLEPNGGNGDLLLPILERTRGSTMLKSNVPIDAIEIDINRHPALREKSINVIGFDFLEYQGAGATYSHIIMNPPFAEGVKHVLKAWDILFDGEIVAILNAETIRNPFSAERRQLNRLIEDHGEVEFVMDAFMSPDTLRKTEVEVAIVHLVKESNFLADLIAADLDKDQMTDSGLSTGFKEQNEIAIKQGMIENAVLAFNMAVKASREAIFMQARARYYSTLLGDTLEVLHAKDSPQSKASTKTSAEFVRTELGKEYDELKNRAWTSILTSTNITSRLSQKAQNKLRSDFAQVKALDFTVKNIYGFILGLIEKQSEINMDMLLEVFDSITRYRTENRVYYKGWKSNDKHVSQAYRVKHTRFIIPGHGSYSWSDTPSWETTQFLGDFDRVFAMLDGKQKPEYSLVEAFTDHYRDLKGGERISSSYFDIRFFSGTGTIHFFPTNKKLIDRFNRMVGRQRQWLPDENTIVPEDFWLQYEEAEKFAGAIEKKIKNANKTFNGYRGIEWNLHSHEEDQREKATTLFDTAVCEVLEERGYDVVSMLEERQPEPDNKQKLLAA